MKNKSIHILQANPEDASQLAQLAAAIWREHYIPIIGPAQVEYMLEKFQSPEAIATQMINEGYLYFLAFFNEQPAGYMAIRPENDKGSLFLSKLYVEASHRKKGIARAFLDTAIDYCRKNSLSTIWLTVNKRNPSIAAYEKLGFSTADAIVTDIGSGFVMDDYVMKLIVAECI